MILNQLCFSFQSNSIIFHLFFSLVNDIPLNICQSYFLPLEYLMETQTCFEKFNQSSYKQNLLESKVHASIKRHQIKGLINAGEGVSRVALEQNDENSQLSEHLLHLKTSCSGVRLDIKSRQLEQFRFKDETSFIATKVKVIQDQRHQIETEIQKIKVLVEEVRDKKINASLSTKSYEHILDRMKNDQIRGQIKRNQLQKELRRLQKGYKDQTNKIYQVKQLEYLSNRGVKEAEDEVKQLNSFRKDAAADLSSILHEKQALQKKKQERKEKSDMIKEMAAGDLQDADLIRMKKFLNVQQFLRSVLKNKMERLKEFYSPYELAFLKIKGNTSVKDASSLKTDYHNFETSFNQRASWAKYLEEEIVGLESSKKQMKVQYQELQIKELQILESLEEEKLQESHKHSRRELQAKADQCQIVVTSVKEWLKQQAKKMKLQTTDKSDIVILKEICEQLKDKQATQK